MEDWNNIPIPLVEAIRIICNEVLFCISTTTQMNEHLNQVQRKIIENLNIATDEAKKIREAFDERVDRLIEQNLLQIVKMRKEIENTLVTPLRTQIQAVKGEVQDLDKRLTGQLAAQENKIGANFDYLKRELNMQVDILKRQVFAQLQVEGLVSTSLQKQDSMVSNNLGAWLKQYHDSAQEKFEDLQF